MNRGKENREIDVLILQNEKGRIGYLLPTTFFLGLVFFTLQMF
jgi:hypothetical protein